MKHFMSFTLSIIVIAAILTFHQYATAVIGDTSKPTQEKGIIIDDRPGEEKGIIIDDRPGEEKGIIIEN